jgi:two-component system nitrogen regulation sensor histidine kinase GlnL
MPENGATMLQEELLENISTGIVGLDAQLRVVFLNPAAEAMLEASRARILGQPAAQLLALPDAWVETLEQALRERHAIVRRGLGLRLHNGAEAQVDLVVTPLQDEAPLAVLAELQAVDRLLRISREESLLHAQETTRAVIRGLAHEIKNPLGGVRGAAQLLARELPQGELSEYTEIIIREADRLRDLVDRLLGPNRRPQPELLNIHEVLEHVCQLLRAEAGGRFSIERDYDPSLPEIRGDRTQLVQAVLNIMRNAMQALEGHDAPRLRVVTRSQRQFTIGSTRHRLVCRVDIIDNGPGIPEELKHSLFVPMVSGRAEGSGLGLAISQSIVNRHGGLLNCDSEPGHTRFSVYLPMDTAHA